MLAVAIVAALALAIVTADASASASPGATASAKKKCRKAHSKKKKCKRKRKADAPRSPVIRATLSWGNGAADSVDADLFVFDSNGNVAGNGSDTIPLTSLSGMSPGLREARPSPTASSRRRRCGISASESVITARSEPI
jgi:hypothetical protein